jgi:alpha-tubulin suppressor-like RCC1 family protein
MSLRKGKIRGITPPPPPPPAGFYTWGQGYSGELGIGDTLGRSIPSQVGSATDWTVADALVGNGYGLRSGKLYAWGPNDYGQIGNGTQEWFGGYSSPVQVGAQTDWTKVTGSDGYHVFGLRAGKLFAWGYNSNGALGLGSNYMYSSPVQVGANTDWTSIACGYDHTLAIRSGTLWATGYNGNGQLAQDGATYYLSSFVQIGAASDWSLVRARYNTSYAIKTDGTLWAWGDGSYGQMGDGTYEYANSSPIQIGSETDWTMVAPGAYHVLAIRGGKLFAWGYDGYGQLGIGLNTGESFSSPIQVGSETDWIHIASGTGSSYGIRTGGRLYSWGYNGSCQELGLGDCDNRSSPTQIGSLGDWQDWLSVCAGASFAFATR